LISTEHLRLLGSADFLNLSILELTLDDSTDIEYLSSITTILQKNYRTITHVLLCRPPCDSLPHQNTMNAFIDNPHDTFMKLKSLRISLNLIGTVRAFSGNLRKMPCLRTLSLWDGIDDYNWEERIEIDFESHTSPCPTIKTFSCGYVIKNASSLKNVSTVFNQLAVLEASLNDEQIRVVFKNMPGLEEILVLDRYLTDSGITGNPMILSDDTEWSPEVQREYPYIGDMKSTLINKTVHFSVYINKLHV
jgi:hypothetical protein